MKLTKAPNCPCVLHTPSLFKYDTIGYISYFKYSTACSFVIFYPFLTPLVCPYPIVQTPAGHLYAVSTKPSKLHIPLIVVLSILNIISQLLWIALGVVIAEHILHGVQFRHRLLVRSRHIEALQGIHLQCREKTDSLVAVHHYLHPSEPQRCGCLSHSLSYRSRVHQSHTCVLVQPHTQSVKHKSVDSRRSVVGFNSGEHSLLRTLKNVSLRAHTVYPARVIRILLLLSFLVAHFAILGHSRRHVLHGFHHLLVKGNHSSATLAYHNHRLLLLKNHSS